MSATMTNQPEISAGSQRWLTPLDGARAIAAVMVLTTHVAFATGAINSTPFGATLARFDFGVPLFFCLSGFLLYRPFAAAHAHQRSISTSRYYLRRFARVMPAYWLMLVVTLLVLEGNDEASARTWVEHLSLTHVFNTLETSRPGLTHTWSLSVEVSFYVALPALAWLANKWAHGRPRDWVRGEIEFIGTLVVVAVVTRVLAAFEVLPNIAGLWLPANLDWFASGMALAVAQVAAGSGSNARWVHSLHAMAGDSVGCLGTAACLFIISTTPVGGPVQFVDSTAGQELTKHWLYGLAAALALLPSMLHQGGRWNEALSCRPLQALGRISYGIFLWHLLLLSLLRPALGLPLFGGGFFQLWLATFACTIVVAYASWRFVESPVIRWSHRSQIGARPTANATHDIAATASTDGDISSR